MMLRKTPILLLALVSLSPGTGHADSSGPSNYDECILDAMRGVSSDVAARAIIDSCRSLFPAASPDPEPEPQAAPAPAGMSAAPAAALALPADAAHARELTADELGRLRATARIFGSAYRVKIDNNNPHLTLTEVTIAVWDDTDQTVSREEYSEAVQIAPQASATVKYTVHYRGDETGWNWDVVAARGVE